MSDNPNIRIVHRLPAVGMDELVAKHMAAGEDEETAIELAMEEWEPPTTCSGCGQEAQGWSFVGDLRYCHPDEGPSCYMRAISGRA